MDFRLIAALSFCTTFAGCTGPGGLFGGDDGLLTADEAIAEALRISPGATLVGVYGVEGPQLQVELPRLAFRDDGLDDGAFGDGRLSSWVVGLRVNESLVERRIFGDGRPAVFFEGDVPDVFQDRQVFILTRPHVDSPEATAAAFEACDLAPMPGVPAGYLYAFSLYNERPRSDWWFRDSAAIPFDSLGLSHQAETWTVVAIDLTAGSDHVARTATLSAEGTSARCRTETPRSATQVFWASDFWSEPMAKSDAPALYPYPFEVGERAVLVQGHFWVQGHDQTPPGMQLPATIATPPVGRLTMADGSVLFEGDAWYRVDVDVDRERLAPGTWLLEARSDGHVGQRMHVGGELWALERLLP